MRHRASMLSIFVLVVAQLALALGVAWGVAQAYIAYECGTSEYRDEHPAKCAGGFPYSVP